VYNVFIIQMATGEFGLLLELAVPPAEEELKLTQEFATTQLLLMEEPLALDQALKAHHATHSCVS
jgi:hypothetical protein